MLWMATVNPSGRRGRRRRRVRLGRNSRGQFLKRAKSKSRRSGRRSGRRGLSAWQRMVKKYGGVMQAVRARKGLKRGHKSRRSAVSRASARGRSRKHHKEVSMARTARRRRRRTPPRGRGGRFVGRRNPGGRRRRRRSNPLFRASRSGKYSRRGRRRLHQIRPGGKGWHNPRRRRSYRRNSVIPVSWNPKRRRRSYRRNSVLPISWNPGGAVSGVVGRVKSFIDVKFWTDTALPATAGFLGAKVVGGIVYGFVGEKLMGLTGVEKHAPYVRIGSQAVATAGLSWVVGRFFGAKRGQAVFLGGVVAVAHALLKEILGGTQIASAIGLDGLGDDLSSRMREAVQRRVQASLNGVGAYMTYDRATQVNGMGAYVTERELRSRQEYAPAPTADLRDYEVNRTETSF